MYNYVVVQFYPWLKFYFPLFWGMVLCMIMSLKQREIKFEPSIKLNHNIYSQLVFNQCITLLFTFFPLAIQTKILGYVMGFITRFSKNDTKGAYIRVS